MGSLSQWLERGWYQGSAWLTPLRPLAALVSLEARRRLHRFQRHATPPPVPVLIVGNITAGGTGKTPLVVALAEQARQRGLNVVVISRGYGVQAEHYPCEVHADSDARKVGDEPVLIARRTGVPVILDPQRRHALEYAVQHYQPDLVISDDGLQHYALPRSAEIIVLDGQRGLGNGRCLPAGPLREPVERLGDVDFLVSTGGGWSGAHSLLMVPDAFQPLAGGDTLDGEAFLRRYPQVHAVAGIGNPQRFFNLLNLVGLSIHPHVFSDHHAFESADLAFPDDLPVVMTEKDAVKCRDFAQPHWWYLPVTARLPEGVLDQMIDKALASHGADERGCA